MAKKRKRRRSARPHETMYAPSKTRKNTAVMLNLFSIILVSSTIFFFINSAMILLSFSYGEAFIKNVNYDKVRKGIWMDGGEYDPPEYREYDEWNFSYSFAFEEKVYTGKSYSYLGFKRLDRTKLQEKEKVYFFLLYPELNVYEPGTAGERMLGIFLNTLACALLFIPAYFLFKKARKLGSSPGENGQEEV